MIRLFQVASVVIPEGEALCKIGHWVLGNEGLDVAATLPVFALRPATATIVLIFGFSPLCQFGKLLFHQSGNKLPLNTRYGSEIDQTLSR